MISTSLSTSFSDNSFVLTKSWQSCSSHAYFCEDFIPSRPNFRKANLLFFSSSISLSNSSGGFSWCLPWPPWAPKYSLVRHFCMLTCLVTNCWISFLKICLDLALSLVVSWKNLMDSCLIFSSDTLPLRRQSSYQAKVSPFDRGMLAEMRLSLKRSRARLDKGKRPSKVQNKREEGVKGQTCC